MAGKKVFTLSEVAQHKSKNDCWLVINGKVLNVTKFLEEHPGGEEVLIESSGKDATKEFEEIGHSNAAQKLLQKYKVGVLQGYVFKEADTKDDSLLNQEVKKNDMEAFIIKDSHKPKHGALLEFLVPVLVAGSYFAYRYVARVNETVS